MWDQKGKLDYVLVDDMPISASPPLSFLLDEHRWNELSESLGLIAVWKYDTCNSVARDTRRIPVKPISMNEDEEAHLSQSYDGLCRLFPVDIYPHNIAAVDGLLQSIRKCQLIDGFGLCGTPRDSKYSILLSDIAIYWQWFRIVYSYSGLAPMRHDLFSVLGLWHTYQHAHRLLWCEFRSAFLADAFFSLWPTQTLLLQPKLKQSATFVGWLLLAYRRFRPQLLASFRLIRAEVLLYQMFFTAALRSGDVDDYNLRSRVHCLAPLFCVASYRDKYVALCNLLYLFEFAIPTLIDYGASIKLGDYGVWKEALKCILKLYINSTSAGTLTCCLNFASRF